MMGHSSHLNRNGDFMVALGHGPTVRQTALVLG